MKSKRAQKARKYFAGGTMPDGMELFPLTQGKLEILMELSDELEVDELEHVTIYLYATKLEQIETESNAGTLAENARVFCRNQTREDIESAQRHIEADFSAMGASSAQPESGAGGKPNSPASRSPGPATKQPQSAISG